MRLPDLRRIARIAMARCSREAIGSLSNDDDDDGNKNGKKAVGLDWQNNNSARAARFFVPFFAVVARLRGETA